MAKQKKINKNETRCPKCNSTFTYIRIKEKSLVCRKCGHTGRIKDEKA